MLWGRVTYEMMEGYWPAVARGDEEAPPALREWAVKLEAKPKYVVSSTRTDFPWPNSHHIAVPPPLPIPPPLHTTLPHCLQLHQRMAPAGRYAPSVVMPMNSGRVLMSVSRDLRTGVQKVKG